jgi:hypothetical protein
MNPVQNLSPEQFEDLVRRAAALPDAPQSWVDRAVGAFAAAATPSMGEVAQSAWRLVSAVLSFDSWAGTPTPATVRGVPSDVRQLLFSAEGRDIDLRISPAADDFSLMGQVLGPDETGTVELARQAAPQAGLAMAPLHTSSLDELGEFRIEGLARGTYRLTLRVGNDAIALPPIQVGERPR